MSGKEHLSHSDLESTASNPSENYIKKGKKRKRKNSKHKHKNAEIEAKPEEEEKKEEEEVDPCAKPKPPPKPEPKECQCDCHNKDPNINEELFIECIEYRVGEMFRQKQQDEENRRRLREEEAELLRRQRAEEKKRREAEELIRRMREERERRLQEEERKRQAYIDWRHAHMKTHKQFTERRKTAEDIKNEKLMGKENATKLRIKINENIARMSLLRNSADNGTTKTVSVSKTRNSADNGTTTTTRNSSYMPSVSNTTNTRNKQPINTNQTRTLNINSQQKQKKQGFFKRCWVKSTKFFRKQ